MGKIEFDHTGSGGGITLSSDGTGLLVDGGAVGGGGSAFDAPEVKTSSWSVTNADKGKVFIVDTDNLTLTLPEDSTLDDDWFIRIYTKGNSFQPSYGQVGDLTIDPQYSLHSGRVNGNTDWTMRSRQGGILFVDPEASNNFIFDTHSTNWDIDVHSTANANRANATGWGSIAISGQATACATGAISLGYLSTACGSDSVAIGGNSAQACATDAIALGNSHASGMNSVAIAIDNNTSSYGSTSGSAISIGKLAKAGGSSAVAIGAGAFGVGGNSVTIGKDSQSCQQGGVAVGHMARNYTNDAVAIGRNACTHGYSAIAIGCSYAGGNDSIAIGIKNCTNTFGTTTACAMSIGLLSKATGTFAQAIGFCAQATSSSSLSLGYCAISQTGTQAMAIGFCACADSIETTSVGPLTKTNSFYSTALGSQAIAGASATVGQRSISLSKSYAGGNDSFAAVITDNTSSYGATGANSVAIGQQAKATSSGSVALGSYANANGYASLAIGSGPAACGTYSVALGFQTTACGTGSFAFGATTHLYPAHANASNSFAFGPASRAILSGKMVISGGDLIAGSTYQFGLQAGIQVLRNQTVDATPKVLVSDTSLSSPNTTNQIVLPNNSAYAFHGTIVARQQASQGTASAAWKIEGLIRREGSAATTVLVNSATTILDNTYGWGMAISADTTNGGLKIEVTGAAATNIRFVATITTSEVVYS